MHLADDFIQSDFLIICVINFKGKVHPKMKISQRFTHPQGILCVSDIPLSDKFRHIQSYIPHCPVCVCLKEEYQTRLGCLVGE